MKTCTKCGVAKPLDQYHRNIACSDFKRPDCKSCVSAARRKKYADDPSERERARISHAATRERRRQREREWRAANPEIARIRDAANYALQAEKALARAKLRYAVATGEVARQPCEICGATKTEGHHADYSKPLEVRWLCKEHHTDLHFPNRVKTDG